VQKLLENINLAESDDCLDVVVGHVLGRVALVLAQDMVCHDDCRENRETLQENKS
jgi:hypothetical protein